MAKRKKATAETTTLENTHALEFASEIRLRDADADRDSPLSEDRDTEPAPPPSFGEAGTVWSDFDRSLIMSTLRLEDALHDCTCVEAAVHVRQVLRDADALADALFVLWSQARASQPPWARCLPRVYRWASEVVEQLEEALVVGRHDELDIQRAFRLLGSYSSLFIQGLIEPVLREAVSEATHTRQDDEAKRLRAVSEHVALLDWTITCASAER
jgi:hypothetical protein